MNGQHVTPLVAVESGRDERPHLIQNEGRGDEDSRQERDLQIHVEGVGRVQVDQLLLQAVIGQRLHDGLLHQTEDLLVIPPADAESADDGEEAKDDAAAQLLKMIEEAHPRHFFRGALLGFL